MPTFSVRLSQELNEELQKLAVKEDRSRNYLILQAIEDYIKKNKD